MSSRSTLAAGDAMTLTTPAQTALVAALEAEIADDTTGAAIKQAIVDKLIENLPSLDDLTLSAIAQAVWTSLVSGLTTPDSIGKLIVDRLDAQVSSRLAGADYTAPDNAGIGTAASNATLAKTAADAAAEAASLAAGNAADAASAAGAVSTKLSGLTENSGGDRFTVHALSAAPAGSGPNAEDIATAVDTRLSATHGVGSWVSVGGVGGEGTITYQYGPLTNLMTGQPVDDVLVEVSTNEAMTNIIQTARTNAFGMATLVFDSPGQYWFRASKSGFAMSAPEMVEVSA